jgi:hypothetical protein
MGAKIDAVRLVRLLVAVALLLCAAPAVQAMRCLTPGPMLDSLILAGGQQGLSSAVARPELEPSDVVWMVYSGGRIGLFVGNNPLDGIDPLGWSDENHPPNISLTLYQLPTHQSVYNSPGVASLSEVYPWETRPRYSPSQRLGPAATEAMTRGSNPDVTGRTAIPEITATIYASLLPYKCPAAEGRLFRSVASGESMDAGLFTRIQNAFERTPGCIMASDANSEMHLGPDLAYEGGTLNENVIMLRRAPSTASVYEELIHTAQLRRGMTRAEGGWIDMEIEAQQKLIRFADMYKIPAQDTAASIARLRELQSLKR